MKQHQKYWNGLEEYNSSPEFQEDRKKEFKNELPLEDALSEESLGLKANRRDFLKIFGFGLTAAALAACTETPVKKAIPYVIKPDNVTPGVPSWYASTCQGCSAGCGILVKSREGRPIKIEGNPHSPISKGGVCAIGQATVLNLYDSERKNMNGGSHWKKFDEAAAAALASGGKVAVVTPYLNSPVSKKIVSGFLSQFGSASHVEYSPAGYDAIAKAHQANFGKAVTPTYHFENADVIVSFGADFLGSWISPVEFTKGYAQNRKINSGHASAKMSKHFQFEPTMSLTGSNADMRVPVDGNNLGLALLNLYNIIAGKTGQSGVSVDKFNLAGNALNAAADALIAAKGRSLVVCGANDVNLQVVTNAINTLLNNYGSTVDMDKASHQAGADYGKMVDLVSQMNSGQISTVILADVNPVYNYHDAAALKAGLAKVKNVIALTYKEDETAKAAKLFAPISHYLESWDVVEPKKGHYGIVQPTVNPLFGTRQWQETLLKWTPDAPTSEMLVFASTWFSDTLLGTQSKISSAKAFWEDAVRHGGYSVAGHMAAHMDHEAEGEMAAEDDAATGAVNWDLSGAAAKFGKKGSGSSVVAYQKIGIRDGEWANNPWLQEMPDPLTKVTWDNYVTVPYKWAMDNDITDGDMVKLGGAGAEVTLPAVILPGQAANTFAVSLGYGRTAAGITANKIGANAYPFAKPEKGGRERRYMASGASIAKTGDKMELAKTQTYMGYDLQNEGGVVGGVEGRESIEDRIGRSIVKETTLGEFHKNEAAGNTNRAHILEENNLMTLWSKHDKKGHHWGMAIDLNSCTGCGACIVSCNAENNVPMVGKEEVKTRREMHWMRIDRYFKGDPSDQVGGLSVVHQPLMCQHCDNAPCESVCPVLATVHSDEGLNQQVYNRCIGTRYCANNCPYKVRRFNWFSYYSNDKFKSEERNAPNWHMYPENKVGRLVLNPDVTVRARGVMEKCSLCVQRIQAGKLTAKVERRKVKDGEIKTACQQSCPADAIYFGDLNDKNSEIHKLFYKNKRFFHALEEVKTLPTVGYLTKVRNTENSTEV